MNRPTSDSGVPERPRSTRLGRTLALTGMADLWHAMSKDEKRPADFTGLALMVASAACFSLMAVFIRLFLEKSPSQSVVFTRAVAMTLVFGCMAWAKGVPLVGRQPGKLVLRGLLGYGAVSCYFWSVNHVGIADAVLLQYSHPIFVALLAPMILGEIPGRWHWPLVGIAFCGLAVVVGSGSALGGAIRTEALVGLLGSLLSGLAYITIRKLSSTEHPLTILVWFPAVMIPGSLAGVIAAGGDAWPKHGGEWLGHALVIVSGLLGQFALTEGLARAGAARATAVTMAGPIFGLAADWLAFGKIPAVGTIVATVIVMSALILLALGRPVVKAAAAVFAVLVCGGTTLSAQEPAETPRVRRVAALLRLEHARIDDPAAWRDALRSPLDPGLLVQGVTGLGRVGHPDLKVAFAELLQDRPGPWSERLQSAVASAIGRFGDPDLLATWHRSLDEVHVARALGACGRWPSDAKARAEIEGRLSHRDVPPADGEAGEERDPIAVRLIRLTGMADPEGDTLAAALLAGETETIRLRAALHRFVRGPRAPAGLRPLLVAQLDDLDGEVAGLAARALMRSEGAGEREAAAVAERLMLGGPRLATLDRLAALGLAANESGVSAILAHLAAADPQVRRAAAEASAPKSGALPGSRLHGVVTALSAVADDSKEVDDVRRAAMMSLGSVAPATARARRDAWRLSEAPMLRGAAFAASAVGRVDEPLAVAFDDADRRVAQSLLEAVVARFEGGRPFEATEIDVLNRWCGFAEKPSPALEGRFGDDSVRRALIAQIAAGLLKSKVRSGVPSGWVRELAAALAPADVEPLQAWLEVATLAPSVEDRPWLEGLLVHEVDDIRHRARTALVAGGLRVEVARRTLAGTSASALPWEEIAADLEDPRIHVWEVETERCGTFTIHLDDAAAPVTVWRLCRLAREGYFAGGSFHRVVPAFVIQGGCPRGDGWGGPGWVQRCELSDLPYEAGTVGMALAGKDTGGSQWFVTHRRTPHLDGRYTVFGRVVDGMDVVDSVLPGERIVAVRARMLPE